MDKRTQTEILWAIIVLCVCCVMWWYHKPSGQKKCVPVHNKCVLITLNGLFVDDEGNLLTQNLFKIQKLFSDWKIVYLLYTIGALGELAIAELVAKHLPDTRDRLVCTQTVEGRGSIARELQPDLFIDANSELATLLQGKVPLVKTSL